MAITTVLARTASPVPSSQSEWASVAAIGALQARHLDRNGDLHAEFHNLAEGASGEPHAGDAGGKSEVVLDPSRGSSLAAEGLLVERKHRQALRAGVDGRGQSRGAGADTMATS